MNFKYFFYIFLFKKNYPLSAIISIFNVVLFIPICIYTRNYIPDTESIYNDNSNYLLYHDLQYNIMEEVSTTNIV
jgi:hypothetical protein